MMHPQAIARKNAAEPIRWLSQSGLIAQGPILHHGRGRDITGSKLLAKIGPVAEYDPAVPGIDNRAVCAARRYAAVVSVFVLNILPPADRAHALGDISTAIGRGGTAYIAVRNAQDPDSKRKAHTWLREYDGFTNGHLFQRFYTPAELGAELRRIFKTVVILRKTASSLIAMAANKALLPERGKAFGVGKEMGYRVYLHREFFEKHFPHDLSRAVKKLPKGFDFTIVRFDGRDGSAAFIASPNFNTADEPIVGDSWLIKKDGSIKLTPQAADPWIYHHKWLMVGEDYKGFDVEESRRRSFMWSQLPDIDHSRIGKQSYWLKNVVPLIAQ
jgi:hypothetical protein